MQQEISHLKNRLQSVDESVQSRQLKSEEALKKELMGYLEKTAEEHYRDFSELLKKSTKVTCSETVKNQPEWFALFSNISRYRQYKSNL